MEPNVKASFIPDKMTAQKRGGGLPSTGSAADIFVLLAVVALAASLALAAGVFLYDKFISSSAQRKSEQLERARAAFEPALIQELLRLDARLTSAGDVLNRHLAPSQLFRLLEEFTLQSVAFETMEYKVNENDEITLALSGKASSVNGVALQASLFGQHNAIVNPIFSDLDLVADGVTFKVTASINPAAIRYTNIAGQSPAGSFNSAPAPASAGEATGFTETVPEAEEFGEFGGAGAQ
ncbi:MAG: hypothetical protein Q8P16_00965 [bacterium]|nr:hypothetical protein [bacterium]